MNRDLIERTLFGIINSKLNPLFEKSNLYPYKFIPHLSSYSKSSSNIYFIFETINEQKEYYLLVFNLLLLDTTSFHKIPLPNKAFTIKKSIFNFNLSNSVNNNQETFLLLTENNVLYLYNLANNKLSQLNVPLNNIIKVKFSPFENIISILYSNNIFIVFHLYTNKEILKLNLSNNSKNSVVVDFNFFPYSKSYSLFSVLFMYENGTFSIITPFFPDDTYIDISILPKLKEINSVHCQSIEKTLNDSLITKMNSCIGKDNFIHLNDYLLNWNEKLQYKHIEPSNNYSNNKYKCFYFIEDNTTPFVLLRIGNNVIDVITILGEILPYREMKISINKKNLTENLNNVLLFYIIETLLIDETQLVNQEINAVNLCNNKIGLIINNGNIYTIEMPYLKSLNDLLLNNNVSGDICLYDFQSRFNKILHCNNKSYQILPMIIFDNEILIINYTLQNEMKIKLFPLIIDHNNNNIMIIHNKQISSLVEIDSLEKYIQPFQKEMNRQFEMFPLKEKKLDLLDNINLSSSEYEIDIINKVNNDSLEIQKQYKAILDRIEFVLPFQTKFDNLIQKVISSSDSCINEALGISTLKEEIIRKNYLIYKKIDFLKNELKKIQHNENNQNNNLNKKKIYKTLTNHVKEMKNKVDFIYNKVNKSYNKVIDDNTDIEFVPKGIGITLRSLNKLEEFYLLKKNIRNLMDNLNANN